MTTTTECVLMKIPAVALSEASAYCRVLFDQQFVRVLIERLDKANEQMEALG